MVHLLPSNTLIFTLSSKCDESCQALEYRAPCLEHELQDFSVLAFSTKYSQVDKFMCALLMASFQEARL